MKTRLGIFLATLLLGSAAHAVPISWTDWTAADAATATGTVEGLQVDFTGPQNPASQTNGGFNYWSINPEIYRGGDIDNGPEASSDIIRITNAATYTITFSEAVINPVMAILSQGRPTLPVRYFFDQAFDVINSGQGAFGGNPAGSLFEEAGNVLLGIEGHGVIQFTGTFTEISWRTDPAEFWHGFQVGIAGVAAPVPEPGTLALLAAGLLSLALRRRRRG